MSCRKFVELVFIIWELHRLFRCSFYLFKAKLIDLGVEGARGRGWLLFQSSYLLRNSLKRQLNKRKISLSQNLGLETSIRVSLKSPALIAWLASWYMHEIGSYSNIRWVAWSCPSSLMNISNRSSLLRPGALTKLSLRAVWFLFAKTFEKKMLVRSVKTTIRGEEVLSTIIKKT